MNYLSNFKNTIKERDFIKLKKLWEEYILNDLNPEELIKILKLINSSEFASLFGEHAEETLDVLANVKDENLYYHLLKAILDLQTTNSNQLAQLTKNVLEKKHGKDKFFKKKMHLVGLRDCKDFKGALSKYELLSHLDKDKFVYHTGGFGTGEIIEISLVREQIILEFDSVEGFKEVSFQNALNNFIPLPNDHFYARRFGFPDELEKEAKKSPLKVVKLLLKDLGQKTAAEIKDNLLEWVIPAKDWPKWWQNVRAKMKKDNMIESPKSSNGNFSLREESISHEKRFSLEIEKLEKASEVLPFVYKFMRDFKDTLKSSELKNKLKNKLEGLLKEELPKHLILQLQFLLIELGSDDSAAKELICSYKNLEELIDQIEIASYKKRALLIIRERNNDWANVFLHLLLNIQQSALRDYLLQQLNTKDNSDLLKEQLLKLMNHPSSFPEAFVWYFQKLFNKEEIPFNDKDGKACFFESLFALMHSLERNKLKRELLKKIHSILCGNRYLIMRSMIADANIEFAKEILLLTTKSQTLSDHDIKIMHSLTKAVHPSIFEGEEYEKYSEKEEDNTTWTTQDGFLKIQDRIKQITNTDIVENTKEIEEARAFGDLRENAEFKAAIERRDRLQAELKLLSDQLNLCKIITKDVVPKNRVGIGSVITLTEPQKETVQYTILGPWDADPDNNVISFQSKLAKAMMDKKEGDTFSFQSQDFNVKSIANYFDR